MRRTLVGIGVGALVATTFTAVPPATAQPNAVPRVVPAAVTPAPNPAIAETCGLDATLILDASGSIKSAGAVNTVRNAGYDLLAALKDTNSTLRITQFGTFSGQLSSRVPVDASTTGAGGSLASAMAKYYTPPPPRPAGVTIYNGSTVDNSALTYTNWEAAIKDIDRPELAIFMTDGDPTAYTVNSSRTNVNTSSTGLALDNAVTQANILKTDKTRMLVVGVGSGLTSTSSQNRLKQISGPQLETSPAALVGKTINQVDAVAFPQFDALGAFLRSVVTSLCGNSVTVKKLAQTSASSDYVPTSGWDITVAPSVTGGFTWVDPTGPDNSAQTRTTSGAQGSAAFQWKPKQANQKTTVTVSEQVKSDYLANRWSCDVKDDAGGTTTVNGTLSNQSPSFQFQMDPSDVATCALYNDFDYAPAMEVTKAAADDPVRGNGVGWNEQYTITVTNTGNTPLTVAKPIDPQCSSITGPTGPGAASGSLQPATTWSYICQAKIGPLATVTGPLSRDNIVTVNAIDPTGTKVTETASESVAVKTPGIAIDKTAKKTVSGTTIPDGGTVPAGTDVTYVYTVTNTGNDTLNLVRASAVTDDRCSPVTYKSGDTNNNQKLETSETWVYECTRTLNPPSSVSSITNTATVTSSWSNPQDRPQNNAAVTDSDRMTINITRSASLRIVKVTQPGNVNKNFPFTVAGQGVPTADQAFDLNTSTDPSTPSFSRTIELDGPDGNGSEYTITEGPATGWDLTSLECDKATTPDGPRSLKVTILPEEDVTCTFTNKRPPSLEITKQTNPRGSTQEFGFTAGDSLGTFTLTDGTSHTLIDLTPGPVSVTEDTLPAGWELDSIICNHPSTVTGAKVELTLDYGDRAQCTYVNAVVPPATLTIVKDSAPATWSPTFDFTASGAGLVDPGQPGSRNFSLGLGDSKIYSVHPASTGTAYTVVEKAQPTPPADNSGFQLTSLECVLNGDTQNPVVGDTGTGEVQVTLSPGDTGVCTYRNEQKPRLQIVKNAIDPSTPDDDTAFTYTATGLTPPEFSLKNSANTQVFTDVEPGSEFTVSEVPSENWTLTSLQCSGQGSSDVSIDIDKAKVFALSGLTWGDDVVCTYVNTRVPEKAYLIVLKNTDPAGAPDTFNFTVTGPNMDEPFPLTDGDYAGFEVDPGSFTVTETVTPGWQLSDLGCVLSSDTQNPIPGNTGTGQVEVTLLPRDVAVCVFDNQKLGSLTVDKVTDVESTTEFDFTALSDPTGLAPDSFTLTGGGTPQVFSGITPGTRVTLTETVPTGPPDRWELSDITCDGGTATNITLGQAKAEVTVGAGQDVACTYTDTKVPSASVQIVKVADPADGTSFDFTATGTDPGSVSPPDESFSLTPTDDAAQKTLTVYPAAAGEEFTFGEGPLPDGWTLADLECTDQGTPVGTPDLDKRQVTVPVNPGDTITCAFTDVKGASLTVIKSAPDDPQLAFNFSWDAAPPLTFTLQDKQFKTATGLSAGAYTVAETDLPVDWYLDSAQGEHPTCTGTEAEVDYSPTLGAKVTLVAGEDAVCQFANFFNYDPQMTLVKTADRSVALDGQSVTYTYVLTNTSTSQSSLTPAGALNDIVVDDQCSPVTYTGGGTPTTLAPGDSWTFQCTVAAMSPAKATNEATATMKGPKDETLTATDTQTVEVLEPALGLVKSADQPTVYPGTDVTYTYVASNTGTAAFEAPDGATTLDDWISDDMCSPVTYVSGDTGDDKIMSVGEAWTYTCTTPVSVDTTNTGTFSGIPFVGEGADKQTGPEVQATDTEDVAVIQKGVDVTKTASSPGGVMQGDTLLVPVGAEVTYTYEVTSGAATVPMEVLDVTDNKCAPVEYQSGDSNDDGMLDPDETWVYTCSSVFAGVTTVTNTVLVTALEPTLGGLAEDSDQAVVRSFKGSISVTKSPDATLVAKGTTVIYTFTAVNTGTVDLTDVKVTDDKCAPVTYVSGDDGDAVMQPGEQWTFRCGKALDADVTNIADATGKTPDGGTVTDSTSSSVQVIGDRLKPAIAVTKTPSATSVSPGGTVTYRYEVTNAGTMPLANIRVTDDKCSPVTYVSGDDGDGLLTSTANGEGWPDETWVYTCSTRLTGTTTNTVTALGGPWDNGKIVDADVSAKASATVKVTSKEKLPVEVESVKKCKGNTCTLVEASKTSKQGKLDYRVRCRPVGSSASGEVRYCRTKVTKKGAVKVRVMGYPKVKVTVWIVATPKPKYADTFRRNVWKRTWIIKR